MNNIPRHIFLIYRQGKSFIGNAHECAKVMDTYSKSVRRGANSSCINGWLVKKLKTQKHIYCIDINDKHYESDDPKILQPLVWLAPLTIRQYCNNQIEIENGTKFYCKKITVDSEEPFAVQKYYG